MASILILDDRPTERQILTTLLGYQGHRLFEASDGAEGLEIARRERPDLVITDILMPTMDGYEFVRQLRSDPATAGIRVIFYSASYHDREARALAEACGVHYLLQKPVEPEVILRTVHAAFDGKEMPPDTAPSEDFDREHLRLLTDRLARQVAELEAANNRLSVLVETGQQLAREHDPLRLIDGFCSAAREIIGAQFAWILIVDETRGQLRHLVASGLDPSQVEQLSSIQGLPGKVLSERRPVRVADATVDPEVARFLPDALAIRSFLGVPISTPTRLHGALCLANKLGLPEFASGDEHIAGMLAAQAGVAYENAQGSEDMLRLNAELEARIARLTRQIETPRD